MAKKYDVPKPRCATRGLRAQAWWVIRRRKAFTLGEMLDVLATGAGDPRSNLAKYLRLLTSCGILSSVTEPNPKVTSWFGAVRYTLENDVGPLAPVHRKKDRIIYDPNKKVLYPLEKGDGNA